MAVFRNDIRNGKIKVVFWRSEVPERLRLSDRVSWLPVGVRVGRIVTPAVSGSVCLLVARRMCRVAFS